MEAFGYSSSGPSILKERNLGKKEQNTLDILNKIGQLLATKKKFVRRKKHANGRI
jgi:hypothetical protein